MSTRLVAALACGGALAFALTACAPILPPDVLGEIDQVREAPASVEAKEHAPTAYAEAERLRAAARAAFDRDDLAGAQIIGEQALAAYADAVAAGRAVRGERVRVESVAAADLAAERLAELETAHQQVAAEIAAVEDRLEVLRTLEPVQASGTAPAAREKARARAVASLTLEARLLCAAAGLLARSHGGPSAAEPPELVDARTQLSELSAVAQKATAAPIDHAMRARASCLGALTAVRRGAGKGQSAVADGDAMLADLSQLGAGTVQRDDRGVVLTLRELFEGDALASGASKTLDSLAEVAGRHGSFPLQVVLHLAEAPDVRAEARWRSRGAALVGALRGRLGKARVAEAVVAGTSRPIVDPGGKHAARNERAELVFISP